MKKSVTFGITCLLLAFVCACKEKNVAQVETKSVKKADSEIDIKSLPANPASDFEYTLSKDGKSVIITKYIGKNPVLVFPSEIEGIPVSEICSLHAADTKVKLTTLVVPEGITDIPEDFCRMQRQLVQVSLPQSCSIIPYQAFNECESLKNIIIPVGVKIIQGSAFTYSALEKVDLPNSLKEIGGFDMTKLVSISIPDSVETIGESCFQDCKNLTSVTLPKNLRKIGGDAFNGCENLEEIIIPEEITSIEWGDSIITGKLGTFKGCQKLNLKTQAALKKLGYVGAFF